MAARRRALPPVARFFVALASLSGRLKGQSPWPPSASSGSAVKNSTSKGVLIRHLYVWVDGERLFRLRSRREESRPRTVYSLRRRGQPANLRRLFPRS